MHHDRARSTPWMHKPKKLGEERTIYSSRRSITQTGQPQGAEIGGASVEQAVVYSTLPQEYSTLTFRGEVVAGGGGVEGRSEVMYCIEERTYIYYKVHNSHSCIA